jgi:hypothetical protein
VPEFSEKVAKSIREFALKEGIPETLLESVYDARVVKFINDYRKLKEAQAAGSAKRKVAPTAKSVPSKKGTPQNVKEQRQGDALRAKALSGSASKDEELDFLKRISSLSKKL